jgi:hypothetical protein
MIGNDLISNRKSLYRSNNLEEINDESNKKKLYSSYVHLDIRRSSTNQLMVKVLKTSKGLSKEKARIKSENIEYKYQFDRNKLILDSYFLTTPDLKYSSPKIDIILYIPENKVVYLDHSTRSFLYDVTNLQDIYDTDMAKQKSWLQGQIENPNSSLYGRSDLLIGYSPERSEEYKKILIAEGQKYLEEEKQKKLKLEGEKKLKLQKQKELEEQKN